MQLFIDIEPYPAEVLRLQKPEGFDDTFWCMWGSGKYRTHIDCYKELETSYQRLFGARKYADFKSFKRARRHQRLKMRKARA